jgi:disulfide bond formation protein DsbB
VLFSAPLRLSSKQIFAATDFRNVNMRDERIAMATGAVALALLLGALGFQYLDHLAPCEMCHWQRWPHIGAAAIGLVCAQLFKKQARMLAFAALALVAVSGLIGAYQQGMQWHLLPGPAACTGHRYVMGSHVIPVVQCDIVTWRLFGLSLAGYNALVSLTAAALAATLLVRNRK